MRWINIIIIGLITLFTFEMIGFLAISNGSYFWEHRYLFVSIPNYRLLNNGIMTFQPNTTIRQAATYKLPGWDDAVLEYDCSFGTNEYGFTKTAQIGTKYYDYLLLGDSFLEGHGGCSWINEKTVKYLDKTYFNSGIQGIGIEQMNINREFLEEHIEFGNVIILAVSEDFIRPINNEWISNRENCLVHGNCEFQKESWWATNNFQSSNLINISDSWSNIRHKKISSIQLLNFYLSKYSLTYELIYLVHNKLITGKPNKHHAQGSEPQVIDGNIRALMMILEAYPQARLYLIPQRDEVRFHTKNLTTKIVTEKLDRMAIAYSWCNISSNDYMPYDGHLNKDGYKELFDCIIDE